jgi:hypothetical protein
MRLYRLAESIPGLLKSLKIPALLSFSLQTAVYRAVRQRRKIEGRGKASGE